MATVPLSSKWLKSALQWLHASSLTDVHICLPHLFPHLPPPLPPSCLLLCRHAKAADLAPWWRSMNPLHAAAFLNWRAPCLASIAHIATTSADTAGTSVCLLQSTRDKTFIEPDTICHFMINNCTKRLLLCVILVCVSLSLSLSIGSTLRRPDRGGSFERRIGGGSAWISAPLTNNIPGRARRRCGCC